MLHILRGKIRPSKASIYKTSIATAGHSLSMKLNTYEIHQLITSKRAGARFDKL